MKTITLEESLPFGVALQSLLDGRCLGILPGDNTTYVELFKPRWMNPESPDFMLRWHKRAKDEADSSQIRSDQFLGPWRLVIADHRTIMANPDAS